MLDLHALDDDAIAIIANDPSTMRRILAAVNVMSMEAVAERLGISYYRVKILRGKRLKIEKSQDRDDAMPRSDALPPTMPIPGDPLWHPGDIETWGKQTGRLDENGNPKRAQPTGRPRQKRS